MLDKGMSPHTQIQGSPHQPSSLRFCDSPLGSCLLISVSTMYLNVVLAISQWDGKNKLPWPPDSRKRKIHLRSARHQMSMSKTEHCAKEPPELYKHTGAIMGGLHRETGSSPSLRHLGTHSASLRSH